MKARKKRNNKFLAPRTLKTYLAFPEEAQELWDDAGQIVTEVRSGSTLHRAARKFNRNPRRIQRLVRPALRKLRNGRWAARNHDRLLRVLPIPTSEGLVEVGLRDSRQASLLGKYWNAVERYLGTGEVAGLKEFEGTEIIDANGKRFPLLTDLHELDRLGSAGVLSFETIYGKAS